MQSQLLVKLEKKRTCNDACPLILEQEAGQPENLSATLQHLLPGLLTKTLQVLSSHELHPGVPPLLHGHPPFGELHQLHDGSPERVRVGPERRKAGFSVGGSGGGEEREGAAAEEVEEGDAGGGRGGVEEEGEEGRVRGGEDWGGVDFEGGGEVVVEEWGCEEEAEEEEDEGLGSLGIGGSVVGMEGGDHARVELGAVWWDVRVRRRG